MKTEEIVKKAVAIAVDPVQQPGATNNHTIVVAQTLVDVEKIRDDWSSIRDEFGKATPYSHCDYFKQVCDAFDAGIKPHVVAFYDDDKLVALLIGRQATKPVCRLKAIGLRILSMSYWTIAFDGIITNGKESSINAAIEYFDNQLSSGRIDLIKLRHNPLNDKAISKIVNHLQNRFKTIRKSEVHLYRELRDAETGLEISIHSGKTKSTFRRKDRNLAKHFGGAVEMQSLSSPEDVNAFIEDADSIVSQTYQAVLGVGVTNNQRWQAVVNALALMGSFRGYVLRSNDSPIAYIIGSVVNDRFTLFATGFLPKYQNLSPGTVLMNRVLSSLDEEGVRLVDFGFGDAPYKRLHATRIDEDMFLQIYGKRYRNIFAWLFDACNTSVLRIARQTMEKFGLDQSAKRIWRQYLLKRSLHSISKQ